MKKTLVTLAFVLGMTLWHPTPARAQFPPFDLVFAVCQFATPDGMFDDTFCNLGPSEFVNPGDSWYISYLATGAFGDDTTGTLFSGNFAGVFVSAGGCSVYASLTTVEWNLTWQQPDFFGLPAVVVNGQYQLNPWTWVFGSGTQSADGANQIHNSTDGTWPGPQIC